MLRIKRCACESGKLASQCERMRCCKDKLREGGRQTERKQVDFKLESENTGWQMVL